VSLWQNLAFFDKEGKNYNMKYDSTTDMWSGDIFLPQVSIDLFEVGQLFILQKMFNKTTQALEYGYPHTTTNNCDWDAEWETETPDKIFLFQFDRNFNDGTQSALTQEPDGPPLVKYTRLTIPIDYDANQTEYTDPITGKSFIATDEIRSIALQVNLAFSSENENTYKRTLEITDKCTNNVIGKFTVYAESIEEDERLRVMTQNMGYNVIASDSTVFRDTNLKEALPDYVEINLKRKEIMMEGSNIYPFIGSYKGLINAIKFFGYDNLKLKEFWKNVNANSPQFGNYIQSNTVDLFSPTVQFDDKNITLPNKNFRKTSMFSLIYRINKITPGKFTDEDLPKTEELQDFTIEEILIKLFGLKRKLENEYLPLNAHIKGITAEADFFGLLEVTNTVSRNLATVAKVGINTDFKVSPSSCTYLEDLRRFNSFCLAQAAKVNTAIINDPCIVIGPLQQPLPANAQAAAIAQAIINFNNAYVGPLTKGNVSVGQNLVMGPYSPGQIIPEPPIGPDPNSVLGALQNGSSVTIASVAGVYAAYFSRYAPNLNRTLANEVSGESSKSLPDQPGVGAGALVTLTNDSFNTLTWDTVNSTWNQLSNANDFFTFDFNVQGISTGDVYAITDRATSTSVSHTVAVGETVLQVTTSLFNQILVKRSANTDPWIFFDFTQTDNDFGPCIRAYGNDVNRFVPSVVLANSQFGGRFTATQLPGEILFTWNGIGSGNFTEIEWTITKDATDVSPAYYFNIRGAIGTFGTYPITLPYVGNYNVEMKLFDVYNNVSSTEKRSAICVDEKEVEYSGWYQSRKLIYNWDNEGKYTWNNYGSLWNLPIEPSCTWDEETPSLYESLDRVNAILNNFGIGTNTDFQLMNYQNSGAVSFSGPYQWKNLGDKFTNWNNAYHLWWDMTATTGDTPAFFEFNEVVANSYLKIIDQKGISATHFFDSTTDTLAKAVAQLNVSTNSIINKYIYNLVLNAQSNAVYVQAVARYTGVFGDFKFVDMVNVNGERVCSTATGSAGCVSIVYKTSQSVSSNPTWSTAKFINNGKTLPPMTWAMFVYDKCKIVGKTNPKWTISNTTNSSVADIYFESKYLTYLFKDPGKYMISLELTDTNGNKYKKDRNILNIKQTKQNGN
jgi:hypothetical protein